MYDSKQTSKQASNIPKTCCFPAVADKAGQARLWAPAIPAACGARSKLSGQGGDSSRVGEAWIVSLGKGGLR